MSRPPESRVRTHLHNAAEHDFDHIPSAEDAGAPRDGGKSLSIGSHRLSVSDLIKFIGLFVVFGIVALVCIAIWPYVTEIFTEGGVERLLQSMRDAGFFGLVVLFGLQCLQIIVAFIPGEVTEVVAGMLYGPWLGTLIIMLGVITASAIVYWLVHFLGAPFVRSMVPTAYLTKLRQFELEGKLNVVVFVLFLIPGLPKDVFTYLIGLTDMKARTFVLLSSVGRVPGVFVTAFAASGLASGDILESVLIFIALAIVAIVGLVFRDRILDFFSRKKGN